jgi:hypothetical protein
LALTELDRHNYVDGLAIDGEDPKTGELLEAKGPGYDNFIKSKSLEWQDWYVRSGKLQSLLDQLEKQNAAAFNHDNIVHWHIAELRPFNKISEVIEKMNLNRLRTYLTPP